jgi:hypothetical protein
LSQFKEFVVLGVALIKAVSATVWVGMLLMVSIFLYAILVVRLLKQYTEEDSPDYDAETAAHWKHVMGGAYSFFCIMTLENWDPIGEAGYRHVPIILILVIIFIFFVSLAMLNLTTGIIVDSVLQSRSEMDEDGKWIKKEEDEGIILKLFDRTDDDGSGEITMDEFVTVIEACLTDPHLVAILHDLDVGTNFDAEKMFLVFDRNGGGSITRKEWYDGFVRMMGTGKPDAWQLAMLQLSVAYYGHVLEAGLSELNESVEAMISAEAAQASSYDLQFTSPRTDASPSAKSASPGQSPSTPRSGSPASPSRRSPSPAYDSESDLDENEFETIMLSLNAISTELRRYESEFDAIDPQTPRSPFPRKKNSLRPPPVSTNLKPGDFKRSSLIGIGDAPHSARSSRSDYLLKPATPLATPTEISERRRLEERRHSIDSDIDEELAEHAAMAHLRGQHIEIPPRGVAMPTPLSLWGSVETPRQTPRRTRSKELKDGFGFRKD